MTNVSQLIDNRSSFINDVCKRLSEGNNYTLNEQDSKFSFVEFVNKRENELAKTLLKQVRIYLDTNFWILLRDVHLGRSRFEVDNIAYLKIRSLCAENKVVCPISDGVFFEILKQTDTQTRIATAQVIDLFGKGVIIKSYFNRLSQEFYSFLKSAMQGKKPQSIPAFHSIWTFIPHIVGIFSIDMKIHGEEQDKINKIFYNFYSKLRFEELIKMVDLGKHTEGVSDNDSWENLAVKLSNEKRIYTPINSSISQLHADEIAGSLEVIGEQLADVFIVVCREIFPGEESNKLKKTEVLDVARKLVYNCFKYEKDKLAQWLPTSHIHASLHASIRRDLQRNYKANDFIDIKHASAALPYCNVFATDKPLASLIKSGSLCLDQKYNTKVVSDMAELNNHLHCIFPS